MPNTLRIIHAHCSALYSGRGDTYLPPATRMIIVKEDGTVMIHSDKGVKPLNYMTGKVVHSTRTSHLGEPVWSFDTSKESLEITIHHLYSDNTMSLEEDEPGLQRDGTEDQLQEWIAGNIACVKESLIFLEREYETGSGRVDILALDTDTGKQILIEVKRVAASSTVYQVKKYLDACGDECTGMIVALDVRPKTRDLADKRGIPWVEIQGTPWSRER